MPCMPSRQLKRQRLLPRRWLVRQRNFRKMPIPPPPLLRLKLPPQSKLQHRRLQPKKLLHLRNQKGQLSSKLIRNKPQNPLQLRRPHLLQQNQQLSKVDPRPWPSKKDSQLLWITCQLRSKTWPTKRTQSCSKSLTKMRPLGTSNGMMLKSEATACLISDI